MNTSWRTTPAARLLGAAGSWFLFAASFTLLFQGAVVVIALGGSCASGGPYEIAVECPDNVAAFVPLSILGGFIAVGLALMLAGGFGTPLAPWSWAILFVGLSLAFAWGGGVVGWTIFALFAVMGAVPLVLELRANPLRTFLGSRTVRGEAFAFRDNERRAIMSYSAPREGVVAPNAGHLLVGIGIPVVAAALGVVTGLAIF